MFNLIFLIKNYTSCCRLISLSSNIAVEDNKTLRTLCRVTGYMTFSSPIFFPFIKGNSFSCGPLDFYKSIFNISNYIRKIFPLIIERSVLTKFRWKIIITYILSL